jgi:hypothetical protein
MERHTNWGFEMFAVCDLHYTGNVTKYEIPAIAVQVNNNQLNQMQGRYLCFEYEIHSTHDGF